MAGYAVIVGLRAIGAVLQDPSTGLVRELSQIDIDGVDERPGLPKLILVQGEDEIRDREWDVSERRRVLVMEDAQGSSADPVATTWRNHVVHIVVAIVCRPDDGPKDFLAAKYFEQAVINTVDRQLLSPGKLETAGLRNGFQIDDCTRLDSPAIEQDLGIGKVLTATRYELQIRHNRP